MSENRTYSLSEDVIDWIDDFADENDADKSEVVNRAIKVYGAKVSTGEWSDPKFTDKIDKRFENL